jgi:hypothetical protein
MASKNSLKKYCSLSKYLQQNDKELLAAFEDLCQQHLLRPQRDSSGVTLIIPKEKAYRQKILNAIGSTSPEVAVAMLKSLVLRDYYPTPSSFGTNVVNLLGQKVSIEGTSETSVKLDKNMVLTQDKKFIPLNRDNMAVYLLTGKGEISTSNPAAAIVQKPSKMGGSESSSAKKELQKYLEDIYATEIGKVDNIYVKKVYFQLRYIKYGDPEFITGGSEENIIDYLGNDEFSDSYLLDMYCDSCAKDCFKVLLSLFKSNGENAEYSQKITNATKEKYIAIKSETIGVRETIGYPDNYANRVSGIQGPMDIREKVHKYYGDDKQSLGKDLFIVFSNINRDLWNTEPTTDDKIKSFRNYAYLASRVYTCCGDMLKSEFDIARDLTIYGNLLKSDVFKFSPQASFTSENVSLPIPATLPSPLDMKLYSLSGFINKPTNVSGGSSKYAYLVENL